MMKTKKGGIPMKQSPESLAAITKAVAAAYRSVFGSAIEKIVLYGSYARKDNTADSDIDLVAIVHGERADLQKQLEKVWDMCDDLELKYSVLISPTVIPYAEYMKYKNTLPYYRNMEKEGVAISA